jgi:hypothetical protein
MQNTTVKQRQRALWVFLVVVIGLMIAVAILDSTKKPGDINVTYDENSKEVVRRIEGESQSPISGDNTIVFLGVKPLLDMGLSLNQLGKVKDAFNEYSDIFALKIKRISISVDKVNYTVEGDPTVNRVYFITAPFIVDDKTTMTSKLRYTGSDNVELFIYDDKGSLVYNSGIITDIN